MASANEAGMRMDRGGDAALPAAQPATLEGWGEVGRHLGAWGVGFALAVMAWPGGPPRLSTALLGGLIFACTKGALVLAARTDLRRRYADREPSLLPLQSAAAQLVAAMLLSAALAVLRVDGLAPGVALLDGMVSLGVLAALGAAAQLSQRVRRELRVPRLALVGKPDALARAVASAQPGAARMVALLPDGALPGLQAGGSLGNIPIVDVPALERLLVSRAVDRVALLPPLTHSLAEWVAQRCRQAGISCGRGGTLGPSLAALRETLLLSPEALLGRHALEGRPERDRAIDGVIEGRTVLITGSGSALGAELARQLLRHGPARLLLADRAEAPLSMLLRELLPRTAAAVSAHLLDVGDAVAVTRLCGRERPRVIFHLDLHHGAALGERQPAVTARVNVGGTRALVAAALSTDAERLVLAGGFASVHPISVAGATLRLAELTVRVAASTARRRMTVVRLPSLLGREASVVPLWIEEIGRGLPLSITDDYAERRFLTLREAARALLEAAVVGPGDPAAGAVLVPDAGPPRKIVEVAGRVLREAGLRPEIDVPVCRVGLRPGEPMQQQLTWPDEEVRIDAEAGQPDAGNESAPLCLWTARGPLPDPRTFELLLDALLDAARAGHDARVVRTLMTAVPGYRASGAQEHLSADRDEPDALDELAAFGLGGEA